MDMPPGLASGAGVRVFCLALPSYDMAACRCLCVVARFCFALPPKWAGGAWICLRVLAFDHQPKGARVSPNRMTHPCSVRFQGERCLFLVDFTAGVWGGPNFDTA